MTERRSRRPLIAGAMLAFALAGCTRPEPTLLDESDFDGVVEAIHNTDEATTRGWTWCRSLDPYAYYRRTPTSRLWFGGPTTVGATIIDLTPDGSDADYMLSLFEEKAELCVDGFEALDGDTIEPLSGLDSDTVGWRTETYDGYQGELAVIKLDDARLLAVGFQTGEAEPPIELDELIRLALEGVERVGLDD